MDLHWIPMQMWSLYNRCEFLTSPYGQVKTTGFLYFSISVFIRFPQQYFKLWIYVQYVIMSLCGFYCSEMMVCAIVLYLCMLCISHSSCKKKRDESRAQTKTIPQAFWCNAFCNHPLRKSHIWWRLKIRFYLRLFIGNMPMYSVLQLT